MTDKELLELAASAAAIDGWFVEDDEWYGTGIVFTDEDDCNRVWNPLTDDGDALRLAVKLELFIDTNWYNSDAYLFSDKSIATSFASVEEESHNGDPYAATRRAIVRAAAEIGKDMK